MSTATEPNAPAAQPTTQAAEHQDILDRTVRSTRERKSLTECAAAILGVAPEKLCGLLRNVWKTSKGKPDLTDQEMFQGISMIARYELDPIAREIYVTRTSKGLVTMIGIDGWIKILDRTDHYDGFEVNIHEKDDVVEWVETTIHSKKRKYPAVYRAYVKEYKRISGDVANALPLHMLRIFSLRHAARLFVPLSGLVMTEEEAAYMDRHDHDQHFVPAEATEDHKQQATEARAAEEEARKAEKTAEPSTPAPEVLSPDDKADLAADKAADIDALIEHYGQAFEGATASGLIERLHTQAYAEQLLAGNLKVMAKIDKYRDIALHRVK